MQWELKWMLLGGFLAIVGLWCLIWGGVLSVVSVFVMILAVGFFAGGYCGGRPGNGSKPPEYPIEKDEAEGTEDKQTESKG